MDAREDNRAMGTLPPQTYRGRRFGSGGIRTTDRIREESER